ncbi:hypothetical protein ILYODFUR_009211 [Ilyodon furcidens]|uniref:Uncharacterized protein n=1 Tax=Ilyodon furcidens TaxID=33524 RepID=A0ABV0UTY5_9TELE
MNPTWPVSWVQAGGVGIMLSRYCFVTLWAPWYKQHQLNAKLVLAITDHFPSFMTTVYTSSEGYSQQGWCTMVTKQARFLNMAISSLYRCTADEPTYLHMVISI